MDHLSTLTRTADIEADIDLWPAGTTLTEDDVVFEGIPLSLTTSTTPMVCIGVQALPGSAGQPARTGWASIVVVTVLRVGWCSDGRELLIDADLDNEPVHWDEARLLAHRLRLDAVPTVIAASDGIVHRARRHPVASLPDDVRVGDRIAVPTPGPIGRSPLVAEQGDDDDRCIVRGSN